MILPIVRMYDSAQRAADAVAALRKRGFGDADISVIGSTAGTSGGASAEDPLVAAIAAAYVLKSEARIYAEGVRRGGTLVVVRAPFGMGVFAQQTLDKAGPIDSGVPEVSDRAPQFDTAAPFSAGLRLPTIVQGAAPFSAFLVLPTITRRGRTTCEALGLPELSNPNSYLFGEPALANNPAPFSKMLGLPLLRS